jgi:DHA1 family tetracycline resistance protein-like MFS transporter
MTPVKATARGGIVMMVMSVFGFFSNPIAGILIDRVGRTQVIIGGLLASGTGLCLMAITGNPFSPMMFLYVPLVGVGFSSAATGANTLASDAAPKSMRGSIMGSLNMMQPVGVLFFLQVGGLLFDKGGYWAPFLLKGIASLVNAVWIFVIRDRINAAKDAVPDPH